MRHIGLIDCNNFFVSCERLFRPDLMGKPVLVLSSNDGCVVARSQEVKDIGIPMGIPVFQIKDIIKDKKITTFSSHFALYRDISRRVFNVVREEFPLMEQYSVDEAFFTIDIESGDGLEVRLAQLKDRVYREVGIPVSVGVGETKTIAKYASHVAKKTKGTCVLLGTERVSVLASVPLRELWGVGKRTADAYRQYGIVTVADLLSKDQFLIKKLFGVVGVRLWQEVQGIASFPLKMQSHTQQSILHSRSFKTTTNKKELLHDAVAYHVREAGLDLREQGLKATVMQVMLGTSRHGDFFLQGGSKEYVFSEPTNDMFLLVKAAKELVDDIYREGVPYKKAGVLLCHFVPEEIDQGSLFASETAEKTRSLTPLIDSINARVGKGGGLLLGSYAKDKSWHSSQSQKSPAYTTSWNELAVVRA